MIIGKVRVCMKPTGHGHLEPNRVFTIQANTMRQYSKHLSEIKNRFPQQYYEIVEE